MTKQRNRLSSAIDAGASLIAGGSAAFVLFAMPETMVARLFAACGLAAFSPKFQPPFGAGLRLGLAAAAGIVAIAFVWSLMKALDRAPAARTASAEPVRLPEAEPGAPRLRRADAHPDAPARRPLFAGRDLGEPLDLDPADALDADWSEPDEAAEEFVTPPEPLPALAEAPSPLPPFLVPQDDAPEPDRGIAPAEQPEPDAAPDPAPAQEEESIVALMHRFETGLGRKKHALADRALVDPVPPPPAPPQLAAQRAAAAATAAAPEPTEPIAGPAPVGHRLRSAIADLQKVAGR
jgi:hypothetical protein